MYITNFSQGMKKEAIPVPMTLVDICNLNCTFILLNWLTYMVFTYCDGNNERSSSICDLNRISQ